MAAETDAKPEPVLKSEVPDTINGVRDFKGIRDFKGTVYASVHLPCDIKEKMDAILRSKEADTERISIPATTHCTILLGLPREILLPLKFLQNCDSHKGALEDLKDVGQVQKIATKTFGFDINDAMNSIPVMSTPAKMSTSAKTPAKTLGFEAEVASVTKRLAQARAILNSLHQTPQFEMSFYAPEAFPMKPSDSKGTLISTVYRGFKECREIQESLCQHVPRDYLGLPTVYHHDPLVLEPQEYRCHVTWGSLTRVGIERILGHIPVVEPISIGGRSACSVEDESLLGRHMIRSVIFRVVGGDPNDFVDVPLKISSS